MLSSGTPIESLDSAWLSTWADIRIQLHNPPKDPKAIVAWCHRIRDLVVSLFRVRSFLSPNQLTRFESEATDIHLALRAHGLEDGYAIIINNNLRYVLQIWEMNALKWGYNPGSWSSIPKANNEQVILMEGLGKLFAANLPHLDGSCSEHRSPSTEGAGNSESSEIEV
jgi:hypothetical protein